MKFFMLHTYILLIQVHPNSHTIKKGFNPDIDSYSAFFDNKKLGKTNMEELIRKEEVTDLYICGIATDVCVGKHPLHFKNMRVFKHPSPQHSQRLTARSLGSGPS